ncbi:hypothetical protein V8F20_007261 [Naviculisporaceae sp. PSN 640]
MSEKYNFIMDPSGDVLLTLNNPDAPFAVWEGPGISKIVEQTPNGGMGSDEQAADSDSDTDQQTPDGDTHTDEQAADADIDTAPATTPGIMTFLLSSRHLALASPVLKAMFSDKWTEGVKVDNLYHFTAEGWNTEALAVVMNVIHGRWSLVPTTVGLELLAGIAVIVDYYDIREPLQLISSLWMKGFTASSIPTVICRELLLWILISWVFKEQCLELFQQAVRVAILRSKYELKIPDDIPIPSTIFAEINTRRNKSRNNIARGLTDLIGGYSAGSYGCTFECRSMHLGALMSCIHGLGFTYVSYAIPVPNDAFRALDPFIGSSLVDVVERLRTLRSPSWTKVPAGCCSRSPKTSSVDRPYPALHPTYPRSQRSSEVQVDKSSDELRHTCPKAHVCHRGSYGIFGYRTREINLGVGEGYTTCQYNDELGRAGKNLVQRLERELVINFEAFL